MGESLAGGAGPDDVQPLPADRAAGFFDAHPVVFGLAVAGASAALGEFLRRSRRAPDLPRRALWLALALSQTGQIVGLWRLRRRMSAGRFGRPTSGS